MSAARSGKTIKAGQASVLVDGGNSLPRPVTAMCGRLAGNLHPANASNLTAPFVVCIHGIGSNGQYFNLASNSLAREANARGMPVLLIDRPGYGSSQQVHGTTAVASGVAAIRSLVETAIQMDPSLLDRPLVVIGHSFGGAIAYHFAADGGSGLHVSALCVSGIGDKPQPEYLAELKREKLNGEARLPAQYFFGPGDSYDRHSVTALRVATEAPLAHEVGEVAYEWPASWPDVAALITCPVHIRLAEFERIWQADNQAVDRIASALVRSTHVDWGIMCGGGHLYEAHHRGTELVAAQLDFALLSTRR